MCWPMPQETASDWNVVLYLALGAVALGACKLKVPEKSWATKLIRRLVSVLIAALVGSGVFYWRLRVVPGLATGFETWVQALDIVFAHVVVTLPLLLLLWALVVLPARRLYWNLSMIFATRTSRDIGCVTGAVLALGIVCALMWWLLVGTIDLQMILFGAFDRWLGWQYPSSFRFTVLSTHIEQATTDLVNNPVLGRIVGSLGAAVGLILGLGGLLEAISKIEERLKDSRRKK